MGGGAPGKERWEALRNVFSKKSGKKEEKRSGSLFHLNTLGKVPTYLTNLLSAPYLK